MSSPAQPIGQVRPRSPEELYSYFERLQNGTLPFRRIVSAGPVATPVRAVSAAYTMLETDRTILADAAGAAFAVTLPTAARQRGMELLVKRMNAGANNVTVTAAGAETIDGAATVVLAAQYDRVRVQSDGLNWVVVT